MATYALQGPTHAGGSVALQTPGGTAGDLAPTGQGIALLVQVGGTASTVTLPVAQGFDGLAVASRTLVCPVNQLALIPLPDNVYGIGTTAVVYSVTNGVQVAAVRIP